MGFNTTLAAPQYTKLRSASYAGETLLSLFSNRVVFAGQLQDPNLAVNQSWAEFIYNNVTVGAYTDVVVDQVLIISKTSDIKDGSFYRIRKPPTNSIIYCNESSVNYVVGAYFWVIDSYFPQQRLSRPSTSDPSTAIELVDFDVPYKGLPPVVVGISMAYVGYVDSTPKMRRGFDASRSYPLEPGTTITGYQYSFTAATYSIAAGALNTAIVIIDFTTPGEQWGKLDVTLSDGQVWTRHFGIKVHDPVTYPPDTGFDESAAISIPDLQQGYTMTIPAFTGVDSVLANTFAIAWRNDEDYGGVAGSLYGDSSAAVTQKACTTNVATLTAANTFQAGQIVIVAIGNSVFDGTWRIASASAGAFTYNFRTAQTPVSTTGASGIAVVNPQNVDFVGWLQSENDPTQSDQNYSVTSTANFTLTGIGPRMQRLANQLLGFQMMASPALWGQFVNLTPDVAIYHYLARYTTIANLCDVVFDAFGFTPYLIPDNNSQGQNVLDVIRGISGGGSGLSQQVCANVEYSPDGKLGIFFDIGYLNTFFRADVTKVADFDAQDAIAITKSVDPMPTIGKLDATGAYYNPANKQVTVWQARSPGHTQGESSGSATLDNQILRSDTSISATKVELRQRAGNAYEIANNNAALDIDMPDGYNFLTASRSQYYTWTLDVTLAGPHGVNRIIYDTSTWWVIESLSYQQSDNGTRVVRVRFRMVTPVGDLGDDTTPLIPPPNSIPNSLPDLGLPAFPFDDPSLLFPDSGLTPDAVSPAQLAPPPGLAIQGKGQEVIVWSPTEAFFLRNFIALTRPRANDITPSDLGAYSIAQIAADPLSNFTTDVGGFMLASDGVNSAVWHTDSVLPTSPVWTRGATISGVYETIRATMTAGKILIRGTSGGSSVALPVDLDFTTSDYGFAPNGVGPIGSCGPGIGAGITGGHYVGGTGFNTTGGSPTNPAVWITLDLGSAISITSFSFTISTVPTSGGVGFNGQLYVYIPGLGGWQCGLVGATGNLEGTHVNSGTDITSYSGVTKIGFLLYGSSLTTETATLEHLILGGTGSIVVPGGPAVLLSSDYGATFGSPIIVGTAASGATGFDVQRSGLNSFSAADGAVYRATSIGGAYSSYYTITGGVQAACIIIPYYKWSGGLNTSAANPDIIVGLTGPDGSSRTLLWIEGGATAGTVHDLTPVAGFAFDNPNAITVSYNSHLAVFGKVSGVYKLYTTNNKGVTWVNRGTITSPGFIRVRRNDTSAAISGTNKGQLYLVQGSTPVVDYSSFWAAGSGSPPDAGMWPRIMPDSGIVGLETIF